MICALNPKILFKSSVLKPFITDMTMIKTATPKLIPTNEKIEIKKEKNSNVFDLDHSLRGLELFTSSCKSNRNRSWETINYSIKESNL